MKIWDNIAIVIGIDFLHKNFDLIIFELLKQKRDKTIDKI